MPLTKSFSKESKTCSVTFTVPRSLCENVKNINLVGDFNSWSSTENPLTKNRDGSFSATIDLPIETEIQFRYLFDGTRWENDIKADKYRPSSCGDADNSVVVTRTVG